MTELERLRERIEAWLEAMDDMGPHKSDRITKFILGFVVRDIQASIELEAEHNVRMAAHVQCGRLPCPMCNGRD